MSKSAFPGSPDHAATLRRMNLLVVLLVLSNIATGIFSVVLLRRVDERYSTLIRNAVPVLNDVRELMSVTVGAMRATNPRVLASGGSDQANLAAARAQLEAEQKFRMQSISPERFVAAAVDRDSVMRDGAEFDRAAGVFLQLYAAGKSEEANRFREEKLLVAFDTYLGTLGRVADAIESRSLNESKEFTEKTNSLSKIVLGVAGWPLIVLLALLVMTVVFVVVLMFVFRGKELGDMP